MTTLSTLVGVTIFATAARLLARAPVRQSNLLHDALAHRLVPWIMGAIAMAATLVVWGGIDPVAIYHDEAAYLLQAGIFAQGRWVGSPPPLPAFFEQFHVLLTPGLAPKYPPGFALTLVPGAWLHLPAVIPLLLTGVTAGLAFALARRVAGGSVALLAVALWISAPGNLRFRAGFFSEILTSLLWIAGWWALLRWRDSARPALLALAACIGIGAITRPLTMLVFAVPVGVVVLREVLTRRAWWSLAGAMALGTAIMALMPLHNSKVTGNWRTSPYARYTSLYLPFDRMGFGLDSTPAPVTLPADMKDLSRYFGNAHAKHTVRRLPAIALQRVRAVLNDMGGPPALGAAALILVGLVNAPVTVLFAGGTVLLLLAAHLPYAHFNNWTLYYLETFPVVTLLMALGVARAGRALLGSRDASGGSSRLDQLVCASALVVLAALPFRVRSARDEHLSNAAAQLYFQQVLALVPSPAVVFVHYGPRHVSHYSLIQNPTDYDTAPYWIVYDRGAENAELLAMAAGRTAWIYDEEQGVITPLAR